MSPSCNRELVDHLRDSGVIRSESVGAAFERVDRQLFLPDEPAERVYRDGPVPIKKRDGVTLSGASQPTMIAIMLEELRLEPGLRVLEIGAGTGYNAALMAEIVGESGSVVTVDIDEDVTEIARARLDSAGFERVTVLCADGGHGHTPGAPYDRIVLTVGAWDVAPAWYDQLAARGVLLMPLWLSGIEMLVSFEHNGDHLISRGLGNCTFMRLRGEFSGPEGYVPLDDDGLGIQVEDRSTVDPDTMLAHLRSEPEARKPGIEITGSEYADLGVWTALHETRFCIVSVSGETKLSLNGAYGLCDATGLCLFEKDGALRTYGAGAHLTEQLLAEAAAWHDAGRPQVSRYTVRAYPRPHDGSELEYDSGHVLRKRWTDLVITIPEP